MKSQLQDRRLQTSCKSCVFATYDDKTQIGCLHERIEKFRPNVIEAYDEEKEFYVINGLCNLYRNSKWNDGEPDIDKSMAESSLSFDCFIDCSNINDEATDTIINFVSNATYYDKKINWYLFHLDSETQAVKNNVLRIFMSLHKISPKISVCIHKSIYLNEFVTKSNSTYHAVLNATNMHDLGIFTSVNNAINRDIKKFIIGHIHNTDFISNIAYRIEFIKNQNIDYYANVNSIIEQSKNVGMYFEI
jgi:hypothetical protein